ncbi:MAG: protein kinase [Alphaproteobacteria bacterium]|nr:protein kinase [Alphaproteobacteria bacterium]MBV8408561.1 protein kinase [Alphaproteobacteria bacterium]
MTGTSTQPPDEGVDHVALKPGQTIGRYEIVSVLGQGGFGITYRARDVQLGREVAIKEYLPSALAIREGGITVMPRTTKMADDFDWGRERFVTEGRTLATLHRVPAIVQVFDFLQANGTAYIVMELLHGETLEDRIAREGKLKAPEIERILWPLLDGLERVHISGFLHRDIKPANILLDAEGSPTLIDFGASRAAMAGRTTALTAIFTPGYAAPEQMTSAKQGPWTDIYALSATLYHSIVGKPPPSAFDRILHNTCEPLVDLKPAGFMPGLLAGIDAGLAVAARDRPQTVAGWRPMLRMAEAPQADSTIMLGKAAAPQLQHVPVIAQPAGGGGGPASPQPTTRPGASNGGALGALSVEPRAGGNKRNLAMIVAAVVILTLLGGGGYYYWGVIPHGPDPETLRIQQEAKEAEARRLKAEEEAAKLRAEADQRRRDEEAAAARKQQEEAAAAAKKQAEEEARRKIEAELAAQKQAEEEARRKADAEAEARRKAVEDARKAVEFVSGPFDRFGSTLNLIGIKGHPDEVRLQGVDIVNDPALHKVGAEALAVQPRDLHCRQTDRLTDGTPLYRCLITQLNAKQPLADVPDSDRADLALALVKNGLVLASCDAPRSYADAEDDARQRKASLWGRVNVPEYKRRCSK